MIAALAGVHIRATPPALCLVHCLAAPVLVALAPALAENSMVEGVLVGASLAAGAATVWLGHRVHGDRSLLIVFLVALLFLGGKVLLGMEGRPEQVVTMLGSACLLGIVRQDARLRRRCACDGCGCQAVAASGATSLRASRP